MHSAASLYRKQPMFSACCGTTGTSKLAPRAGWLAKRPLRQSHRVHLILRDACREYAVADGTVLTLKLNQQQLELIDRTVARGIAPDRAALVRLALREYADARASDAEKEAKR